MHFLCGVCVCLPNVTIQHVVTQLQHEVISLECPRGRSDWIGRTVRATILRLLKEKIFTSGGDNGSVFLLE